MAWVYRRGEKGVTFSMRLLDESNRWNIVPVDLSGSSRLFLRFTRPDGTSFEKDGAAADQASLAMTDIEYTDAEGTMLDQIGDWEMAAGAEFDDGTSRVSAAGRVFYVV